MEESGDGAAKSISNEHRAGSHLTGEEQELLEKYLTHLNVLGPEGFYPNFEAWYQEIRYAQGPSTHRPWKRRRSCATRASWRRQSCSRLEHQRNNNSATLRSCKVGRTAGTETPDGAARSTRLTRDEWVLSPSGWDSQTPTASACQTSPEG